MCLIGSLLQSAFFGNKCFAIKYTTKKGKISEQFMNTVLNLNTKIDKIDKLVFDITIKENDGSFLCSMYNSKGKKWFVTIYNNAILITESKFLQLMTLKAVKKRKVKTEGL